jgi:hypothetical protein
LLRRRDSRPIILVQGSEVSLAAMHWQTEGMVEA